MFGKDNKPLVVDSIHKAIESEKKVIELFKKEIAEKVNRGETIMTPLAHMIYFNLNRSSIIVQNVSSREMYQALNSVASNCSYDGVKDQCGGTIGDFTLSLSREKDSYGTYLTVSAMPSIATIVQTANKVISDIKAQSNTITNEPDNKYTASEEDIKVISTENMVNVPVEDVVVSNGKFCAQCGTENVNDAKFCKSCGYSLIEKAPSPSPEPTVIQTEPTQEQEVAVNLENTVPVENSTEVPTSLSGWLLLIPVIAWVLYKLGAMAGGNISLMFGFMTVPNILAEALGGAIAIVGLPLIVTSLIYGVKKANGIQYTNFVKHTLIASIALLAFGIAANINTIRDEQNAVVEQTTSEVEPAARPMTTEEILAADSVITAIEPSSPVAEEVSPAAEAAFPVAEEAAAEPIPMTVEEACNNGDYTKCGEVGIMYHEGQGVDQSYTKAMKYLKKACDGGNSNGCKNLGIMYATGEGVEEDSMKAVKILKKACYNGSASGCAALGNVYKWGGNNLEKDIAQAAIFLKKACDSGSNSGCEDYEKLQSQGY